MLGLRVRKSRASILALAISIFVLGCQPAEDETLPLELVGVWKSSAPRFKDDTLELSKEYIIFTSGEFQDFVNVNFIVKVEKKPERKHTLYVIHYDNIHNQRFKLSLYYYPKKVGMIRLKNQMDSEWRKVKPITS